MSTKITTLYLPGRTSKDQAAKIPNFQCGGTIFQVQILMVMFTKYGLEIEELPTVG
jgi:hypothetical protein